MIRFGTDIRAVFICQKIAYLFLTFKARKSPRFRGW
ncbi:hypothetical protein L903_18470 [Agrobacterium sp. JL28]|nr:hypothetical protein L902_01660 [Agrobacterium radiobacter DSM 30147]KVK49859.1 hypothetical protein L903_18470 [Agrobacterium sp. JL28]KVK50151.1 hypothetical protein L904_18470 [Agrobacterium sp. LY4]